MQVLLSFTMKHPMLEVEFYVKLTLHSKEIL
jgi:hypothetical protein